MMSPVSPALAAQTSALETHSSNDRLSADKPLPDNGSQNEGSPSISISAFLPADSDPEQSDNTTGQKPADNHLMIKEAYKLFEGPGSRRVG